MLNDNAILPGSLFELLIKEGSHFADTERWHAAVKHGMTIGAHRPQILDRIDLILAADLGQWPEVMHVNETLCHRTISGAKRELAYCTRCTIPGDAELARPTVTFLRIDCNLISRALKSYQRNIEFLGEQIDALTRRTNRNIARSRQVRAECKLDVFQN